MSKDMHKRLKEARLSTGLTQEEFADKLGMSDGAYGHHERGRSNLKPEKITLVCEITGVSEKWLLTGEGPMKPDEESEKMQVLIDKIKNLQDEEIKIIESMVDIAMKNKE